MTDKAQKSPPTGTFADAMTVEPSVSPSGSFKLKLSGPGGFLGWLGQNGSGWAVLVKEEKDAVSLVYYPWKGQDYFQIEGSSKYMSVGTNWPNKNYIGFYNWLGASGFTRQGDYLVSNLNGQRLSLYSMQDAYIYACDDAEYTPLKVSGFAVSNAA